jgi:hypothetical protein
VVDLSAVLDQSFDKLVPLQTSSLDQWHTFIRQLLLSCAGLRGLNLESPGEEILVMKTASPVGSPRPGEDVPVTAAGLVDLGGRLVMFNSLDQSLLQYCLVCGA